MSAAGDVRYVQQIHDRSHTSGGSQTSAPHWCRHRRPRPLIATTLAAALLTLTLGVGVRIGNTAASVAHATATTCEAP